MTLLPFLAITAMQSSCNPRSLIHNSGCSSHWRLGGGRGGGHWVSLPPGLAGMFLGGGLVSCSFLPLCCPPVPAQGAPLSFSHRSPPHPMSLRALYHHSSLQACDLCSLQDHSSSPQFVNPWQRLGQGAQSVRAGRRAPQRPSEPTPYFPGNTTEGWRGEGSASE